MITTPTTVEELLDYWPGHIPFKGSLVSADGSCMCAQGQALHFLGGLTVDELRDFSQEEADEQVAKLFGISRAHSVLLRFVNDDQEGAPSCVIRNPEQVLGDQAQTVLAFWRHLDRMTLADWEAVREANQGAGWEVGWSLQARTAAGKAAGEAAGKAGSNRGWEVGWRVGWERWGSGSETGWATNEIQGATVMRAKNQPFFFLPLFGFADPEAVMLLDATDGEVGP